MINFKTLTVGQMQTNCYILSDSSTGSVMIIDPGDDPEYIADTVSALAPVEVSVVATHGHFDHILGAYALTVNFQIPLHIHKNDLFLLDRMVQSAGYFLKLREIDPPPENIIEIDDGSKMTFGSAAPEILELPGHTPGSVGFFFPEAAVLFSGDVIFAAGDVGRTDFAYADKIWLDRSIRMILAMPADVKIYPGHGESTTVGEERRFHPQLTGRNNRIK
jgi:hydroxyacylglutathione hydrolase